MPAPHEKLFVYQKSLDAVAKLYRVAREIQAPSADLRDQLRRAAFSVPLNIADGASEFSPLEKQRVYRIARRSAAECLAILDVLDIISEGKADTAAARAARERGARPPREDFGWSRSSQAVGVGRWSSASTV